MQHALRIDGPQHPGHGLRRRLATHEDRAIDSPGAYDLAHDRWEVRIGNDDVCMLKSVDGSHVNGVALAEPEGGQVGSALEIAETKERDADSLGSHDWIQER
jgi:hypothetical protein